jgi:hypothetical protein
MLISCFVDIAIKHYQCVRLNIFIGCFLFKYFSLDIGFLCVTILGKTVEKHVINFQPPHTKSILHAWYATFLFSKTATSIAMLLIHTFQNIFIYLARFDSSTILLLFFRHDYACYLRSSACIIYTRIVLHRKEQTARGLLNSPKKTWFHHRHAEFMPKNSEKQICPGKHGNIIFICPWHALMKWGIHYSHKPRL